MKEKVIDFLQKEIDQKHIPGAVVQVSHQGKTVLEAALGNRIDYAGKREAMQLDTVFDLASLTKVVGALPAVLKLLDSGKLALSDPVSHFIPEFGQNNKEDVKIYHLLTHTSGLTSHRKFYEEGLSKEEIFEKIYAEKLEYETGSKVVYSDLGFILLAKVVEIASDESFEKFVEKEIFKSFGMKETSFLPNFPKERYAATEYSESLESYKLGTVHDENADALGGVSGHAGLFSTIADLKQFVTMIENKGMYKNKQILSPHATQRSQQNFTSFAADFRGLGWQLQSHEASAGDYFNEASYGHTGFTGTSIWFDPTIDLNVILLTNRVHYGRQNHINRLRSRLHNLIRQHFT